MERLTEALQKLAVSRFLALYGLGVSDSYLTSNLLEVDLPTALAQQLKAFHYTRILFVSPTRPLFFLDEQSRELSGSLLWSSTGRSSEDGSLPVMQPGPYGNKLLIPVSSAQVSYSFDAIGDTHLLRLLDAAIREEDGPATVIVFLQAENFIQNNQDVRTLASLIGGWTSLPANNRNRCIFLFSANDYTELADVAANLPVPEMRSLIFSKHETRKNFSIHCLGGPQRDEAGRLIDFIQRNDWTEVDEDFVEPLVDHIGMEAESLHTWISRLSSVAHVRRETAYQAGWFAHFRGDPAPALERLNRLTGLEEVKQRITELAGWAANRPARRAGKLEAPLLHMVFTGNPGTGKTTVARLTGELFYDLHILKRGHLVETKAADLIADHVGGTAIKTNQVVDQALGGVLFIDEAYSLSAAERGGFGAEAIETLLTRMEDNRDDLIVILAGYPDQIRAFLHSNPGLSRRFPAENRFTFQDFSAEQLQEILAALLEERGLKAHQAVREALEKIIAGMAGQKDRSFGNAGEVRNLVDSLERKCLSRLYRSGKREPLLNMADISPEYASYLPKDIPPIDAVLAELDQLVGLGEVKQFIRRKVNRLQFEKMRAQRRAAGGPAPLEHLIFTGNPGTGKTTVARLVGKVYASLGLLRKGHTVEVSMPDLIAGYVGQTTGKVVEQVEKAIDGVLFIDEAYALVRGNSMFQGSFGQEVIDTLVKAMEDQRGRMLVILAGYSREMEVLIRSNPGLRSRFAPPLTFPDFAAEDSLELLERLLAADHLNMADEVRAAFIDQLEASRLAHPADYGNARDVIAAYERAKDRLAERIVTQTAGGRKASLAYEDTWLDVQMEDVAETEYTVVIDGGEAPSGRPNPALKSWVIPRE